MDEHIKTMEALEPTEMLKLNLQLFATVNMKDVIDRDNNDQPIFTTPSDEDVEDTSAPDEPDTLDEDETEVVPIFMPRLMATDKNLPHTAVGELIVRDLDGALFSVSVNADGEVTQDPLLIGEDNLENGSIDGTKIVENSITSRELNMEEILGETALMNQLLAANIDAEGLFENRGFVEKLDERTTDVATELIEELAVQKSGGTMTGPLVLPGFPNEANEAGTKGYVDNQDLLLQYQINDANVALTEKIGKAGDTMTGPLVLPGFPNAANEASTKGYVDNQDLLLQYQINDLVDTGATTTYVDRKDAELQTQVDGVGTQLTGKVSKAGDTMTGALTLPGNPTQNLQAATKQYVDTAVSNVNVNNANTATKLQTARTIGIGGKVTGTATSFDGSQNITINTTAVDATSLNGQSASYYGTASQVSTANSNASSAASTANSAYSLANSAYNLASSGATKAYVDSSIQSAVLNSWSGYY